MKASQILEKRGTEPVQEEPYISIWGAREHNLQNIDIQIPRYQLVVVTGVSGSGKSSLAFDTVYAEGQRRYMETFSAYARQFIGDMERPDVEKITGLSPVISIEQKTTSKNPRSTVGTVTEIYDFLRLLFARASTAYSYNTGKPMVRFTEEQIIQHILEHFEGKKGLLLAPLIRARKGHYRELFDQVRKQGYTKVRVDGEILDLEPGLQVDRYKTHDIELVIDRIKVQPNRHERLRNSLQTALDMGNGLIFFRLHNSDELQAYSKQLMCPESGISYEEPSPNAFSFNSPYGACSKCKGLGVTREVDMDLVIPDADKSINDGGLAPAGEVRDNMTFKQLRAIAQQYGFDFDTPIKDIPKEGMDVILNGGKESLSVPMNYGGRKDRYELSFEGLLPSLRRYFEDSSSDKIRRWAEGFMTKVRCSKCKGQRLNKESLHFKIAEKNIAELAQLDVHSLNDWLQDLDGVFNERETLIASDILKELRLRTSFLLDVGLDYLTLNRPARTLSGGESQRIRLATQIGSQLTGITYILDEPSIGLHQRDNARLIESLRQLTEIGNTVLVVEHDKDIMLASDYLIDLGPGAGKYGGEIVAEGTPESFKQKDSQTARYLSGADDMEVPKKRRKGNGAALKLTGATGNNLKGVDIEIPLGTLTCVTGVSGSGKSTLINETLYPILRQHLYRSRKKPLPYKDFKGLELVDKVIEIDQSPIGRTPRSNPATYIGAFTPIRSLFAGLPEAKIRGYKPGRFSFNVKGGRCETCGGAGRRVIEMQFLPDVEVDCEACGGRRYNRETLEIIYKGKTISDVLDLTVDEAVEFFKSIPKIYRKVKTLQDVGLSYITLGQSATTLSGGEAQRVKLAEELSKRATGQTLYILDEPTTGLHFVDIKMLLKVLDKLVAKGNTVLIIEHNLDVIKMADHIIDVGPEGGHRGGQIVAKGTPEDICKVKKSHTGQFLKKEF